MTAEILLPAPGLAISVGASSASSGTVVFSNDNGVTFGLVGSVLTASVSASAASALINVSAGTTSQNLSNFVLSNDNGVSFGLSGSTVTASASFEPAPLVISAGTQTASVTAITFSNSSNVSFGLSNGVITAVATAETSQGSINVSAGTTSNLSSAFTFGNGNGVSFGLDAGTVTASVLPVGTVRVFSQDADFVTNFPVSQAALSLQKLSLPAYLSATQLAFIADIAGTWASSDALTVSHAVYTLSAGSAKLASSASRVLSFTTGSATTASSVYGGASGTRYRTIPVSYALTPGDYVFAWWVATANGMTVNAFGRAAMNLVGTYDGVETATFLNGLSASTVAALPASFAATDTGYVRTGFSALRQPGGILFGT
jgi:hypothetical protein